MSTKNLNAKTARIIDDFVDDPKHYVSPVKEKDPDRRASFGPRLDKVSGTESFGPVEHTKKSGESVGAETKSHKDATLVPSVRTDPPNVVGRCALDYVPSHTFHA